MICEDCRIDYPGDLVSMYTSTNGSGYLCGICALARSNALHGDHRERFNGEIAESLRQRAIVYRKKLQHA
jgi:hypothetical protein